VLRMLRAFGCLSRSTLGRAHLAHNGRHVRGMAIGLSLVARCAWWLLDWGAIAVSVSSKWSPIGYSESRMDTRSARSPKPGLTTHTWLPDSVSYGRSRRDPLWVTASLAVAAALLQKIAFTDLEVAPGSVRQ